MGGILLAVLNAIVAVIALIFIAKYIRSEKEIKKQMNTLVELIEQWSVDKKINEADSSKQMLKVIEETGEVAAALARSDKAALKDGIGDVVVTLIILAQQNSMTLQECLECAYDEIKGRKGKTVNGVFVKESDLEEESE
jgi:NTP pyrophosphatase (non-canonical NTP hydrolase)